MQPEGCEKCGREKVRVGSSVAEVLDALGKPEKAIEAARPLPKSALYENRTFYKNIDGVQGHCFYRSSVLGVAAWFRNHRVSKLMILPGEL